MLLTVALVVLFSAITIFFSGEFIETFKKLFAIKGAKLFIPLFAASWLIYKFNFWLWGIFYARGVLHDVLDFLVCIMPFQKGTAVLVVLVFMLTFLSVVPVLILDILSRRKNFKGYQYPYVTSGLILILSVFLLIIK